jgi:hypothetical protein
MMPVPVTLAELKGRFEQTALDLAAFKARGARRLPRSQFGKRVIERV